MERPRLDETEPTSGQPWNLFGQDLVSLTVPSGLLLGGHFPRGGGRTLQELARGFNCRVFPLRAMRIESPAEDIRGRDNGPPRAFSPYSPMTEVSSFGQGSVPFPDRVDSQPLEKYLRTVLWAGLIAD